MSVFWKPGSVGPGVDVERESGVEGGDAVVFQIEEGTIQQQRKKLPVYEAKREILYALEKFRTVIVVGQTGSGKTTQIPQYLHENGWTKGKRVVLCTQPRRVAASSIAARVATEMNVTLGKEVGYAVRFDDCWDENITKIKYVTDGMLLRECMSDPLLTKYSVIMIDEAHERTLYTDILIGLLKKIQRRRKELRIIISSATMDAQTFKDFFESNVSKTEKCDPINDTAVIISVDGRQFPVDIFYAKEPVRNYTQAAVATAVDIHQQEGDGDILVFVTGQEDVQDVAQRINDSAGVSKYGHRLNVLQLYSELPASEQMKVFDTSMDKRFRRCIVATNIAETSITIPNIVYVVDSGFAKLKSYDPRSGMEVLVVTPIAQSAANQRAGRAGRMRAGKCFRLFTEDHFYSLLPVQTVPEMQRSNLSWVILQLKALGIDNIVQFDFLSSPPTESMIRGLELLYSLGALDDCCKLTKPIGESLAEFPVEPRLARMLIAAGDMGCSEQLLSIAAMLSVQTVFFAPKSKAHIVDTAKVKYSVAEGDHLTLLNVFNAFLESNKNPQWCHENYVNLRAMNRACEIRKQLRKYCIQFNIPIVEAPVAEAKDLVRKAIVCGFFSNAAQLQSNNTYKSIRGNQELMIHPTSVLYTHAPAWVVFHDIVLTTGKYMRDLTTIDPMWLAELASSPQFYEFKSNYSKVTAIPQSSVSKSIESSIASIFSTGTATDNTKTKSNKDSGHFNLFAIPDEPKPKKLDNFSRSYFDDESEFGNSKFHGSRKK